MDEENNVMSETKIILLHPGRVQVWSRAPLKKDLEHKKAGDFCMQEGKRKYKEAFPMQ